MKITPRKYAQALADVLEKGADPTAAMKNFITMVRRKKQSRLMPKIVAAFETEWNQRKGILKMEVQFPPKFKESLKLFEDNVNKQLGKKSIIIEKPAEHLIGGLRIKMGDSLIDGSIEGRLRALGHAFLA